MKILLIEDDQTLRRGIKLNLEAEGYRVTDFENADAFMDSTAGYDFDLAVLDIMMPGKTDGIALCKTIRTKTHSPVLFLTAKSMLPSKLEAFEAGADDYLTKPFELEELLARVKARLKTNVQEHADNRPVIGEYTVDFESGTATAGNGNVERFTDKEAGILQMLFRNTGRVVSRDEILDEVWGTARYPSNRTIDNTIVKFRKIFGQDCIITRHGKGYELVKTHDS